MKCMENLLNALEACGEAAGFYMGQNILMANKLFAAMFERDPEECVDLPIMEICHEESVEMIHDFIKRRGFGNHGVPTTYSALFRTRHNPKLNLQITVIETKNTEGAFLAILKEMDSED